MVYSNSSDITFTFSNENHSTIDLTNLKIKVEKIVKPNHEEWEFFTRDIKCRSLRKGENLWTENQFCEHLVFIESGCMRYYHIDPHDGKETSLQFIFSNSFLIDYPSFINNELVSFTYEALEQTEIILIPRKQLFESIEKYRVWERFARLVSEQNAISIQKRKNSLILDSPEEQYKKLFEERPKVIQQIPQHMIATYLGITREHLSRIRKRMAGK